MHAAIRLPMSRVRLLPRLLSRGEKVAVSILLTLTIGSGAVIAWRVNARLSVPVPASGGVLREGVQGIPRFINPLLAVSDVDRDLTALVYTGLMRLSSAGELEHSLAETHEISEDGLMYTFTLNEDARWSDGTRLTADDVLFTITTVKNPAYRSPLRANWEGVTVEKLDERTVRFLLAKPYAPFLENTTLGIIPKHVWQNVLPQEFSLTEVNLKPIGAGPYETLTFRQASSGRITSYQMQANKHFLPHKPFIDRVEFQFYASDSELFEALRLGRIDSLGSLPSTAIEETASRGRAILRLTLPRVFGVFFNQNASETLANANVREALELATDRQRIIDEVLSVQGVPAYSPIPPGIFGSVSEELGETYEYNPGKARELVQAAQKKAKTEQPFTFALLTSSAPDLVSTAQLLKSMWGEVGIEADVRIFEISDLEQNVLRPRKYDAVLFGLIVGRDPDPFAFWHASQRNDPGLNIALYTNPKVDTLLEKARTTVDTDAREATYREFQKLLAADRPALFLYSPLYLYVPAPSVRNAPIESIVSPADRFGSVHEWYIKTRNVWKVFAN